MKKIFRAILLSMLIPVMASAKDYSLSSPSGDLKMIITVDDVTSYTLVVKGQTVLENCRIAMELSDGRVLGDNAVVSRDSRGSKFEEISSPLYRQKSFTAAFNYLSLRFEGEYILQVRAYNDGVAYRFSLSFDDAVTVKNEAVQFNFADAYQMYIPFCRPVSDDRYDCSFESLYTVMPAKGQKDERLAFLPVLVKSPEFGALLLTESDVEDYPGMFVQTTKTGLEAVFPPVPATTKADERGVQKPVAYNDYIARTSGSRPFPWRIIAYAEDDTKLPVNNMVYQTAEASRVDDTDWIEAGHSAWDWWNANTLTGVDFKAGINTATYKYHIDFAAAHGMKYVVLDEGWYKNLDMMQIADGIDIEALCSYAQENDVKLLLWTTVGVIEKNLDAICERYASLGVGGFKIDFFDAQDQTTIKEIYEIADAAQKHKLVLDLHGIFKPTGITRTFPNIINMEGVFGLETVKWTPGDQADMPEYDVTIPYIRMAAGPMDYTPGAMRNASRKDFRPVFDHPESQGTRAHQIAEYVVFDAPVSMLCDSPSDYLADVATTDYITSIPSTFDSTEILSGEIGKYIVTKRAKNGRYYIGGLTNWDSRDVDIDLSFLGDGAWVAKVYGDGVNADTIATDHKIQTVDLEGMNLLQMHMAPGGGFAIIIERK